MHLVQCLTNVFAFVLVWVCSPKLNFEGNAMTRGRIMLEPAEIQELTKWMRSSTVSVRDCQRAQIILLAAEGRTQEAIGEAVGVRV